MADRNRFWKRSISGDPFQSEQEAINLARIIHFTLMVFSNLEDALKIASWLEICLRRLYAILYVKSHMEVTPRATLWEIVQSVLETTAGSKQLTGAEDGKSYGSARNVNVKRTNGSEVIMEEERETTNHYHQQLQE